MARASSSVLSLAGRVGGFRRAALYSGQEVTARARATFEASFEQGHACKVCAPVTLPDGLTTGERQRRARALRAAHYSAVALASARARSQKRTAGHAEPTAQESNGALPPTDRRPAA